jgi:hypothetical protein
MVMFLPADFLQAIVAGDERGHREFAASSM